MSVFEAETADVFVEDHFDTALVATEAADEGEVDRGLGRSEVGAVGSCDLRCWV